MDKTPTYHSYCRLNVLDKVIILICSQPKTYCIRCNKKAKTYLTFGFPSCCNMSFVAFKAKSKDSVPTAR